MKRRIIWSAFATIVAAATVAACGGSPPTPTEPHLHEGTRSLQQDISDAGADCTWHNEPHTEYTITTCDDSIELVVTDDDEILRDREKTYRQDIGYGYVARTDSALGAASNMGDAIPLAEGLGAQLDRI